MKWDEITQIANEVKDTLWSRIRKVYDSPGACPDISRSASSALDKMDTAIEVIHGLHPEARIGVVLEGTKEIQVFYSLDNENECNWTGYVMINIIGSEVKHRKIEWK